MKNLTSSTFFEVNTQDLEHNSSQNQKFHRLCGEYGFVELINHPISLTLLQQTGQASRDFFDLPESKKKIIHSELSAQNRGYFTAENETLNENGDVSPELKEGIKIGNELTINDSLPLHGANQWPTDKVIANSQQWRATMSSLYQQFVEFGCQLCNIILQNLGKEDYMNAHNFAKHMCTLAPLRYPSIKGNASAHTDFGLFSFVYQFDEPGLEVKVKKSWLTIQPKKEAIFMNVGEILNLISDNKYPATVHRVINNSNKPRHSTAFFFDPSFDTKIPISATNKHSCAGEYMLARVNKTFSPS